MSVVPEARGSSAARVMAADLAGHVGQQVTIAGWRHRKRELKSVTFIVIRDRTGLVQVVVIGPDDGTAGTCAADCTEETVLAVTGLVVASEQAPGGAEITRPVLTALSEPAEP